MYKIYLRKNTKDNKAYVNITNFNESIEDCWVREGTELRKKSKQMRRRNLKIDEGSLLEAVFIHGTTPKVWLHQMLGQHENLVIVLLLSEQWIKYYNTVENGYNLSNTLNWPNLYQYDVKSIQEIFVEAQQFLDKLLSKCFFNA